LTRRAPTEHKTPMGNKADDASAPSAREHGPATALAIRHMKTLKPEHQQLLAVLLADQGMQQVTLETLVEHLFEEEDPRLVNALRRIQAGSPKNAVIDASARDRATVGNLRRDTTPVASSASVGSLRR
jgi:hypothetical protein